MKSVYKIGIDARFFGAAGPGRYTKALVEHLEKIDTSNDYVIFLRKNNFDLYKPQNPNFKKVLTEVPWYSFKEQFVFLFKVLSYKLDLFYVPHFNIPVLYVGKLVTAIPDITMHTYSTDKGTTLPKFYFMFKKLIYRLVVPWALIRSSYNIVPSTDVLLDFLKEYPWISKEKFVLAYEGIDPILLTTSVKSEDALKKYNIKKPFLLYVSSMSDHKNVQRLILAYELLLSKNEKLPQLVLIGKKDKFSLAIYDLIKQKNLEERILMPGMKNLVPDDEVVALRKSAEIYVFPSLKEGFSLTPLEAQAIGLPCVISNIPCHREIYGDSVLYFSPEDVEDIAEKINQLLHNKSLQKTLIEKGYENIKRYDWLNTAKITLDIFNKVLKK